MLKALLVATALIPFAVQAHHGNFTYDGTTVVMVEGEVLAFHWRNPHGSVRLRTDSGREVDIETDGPSLIQPMGTTPQSLQPGDRVVAYASPSNRGRDHEFLGREFIKADGTLVRVSVAYARQQARADQPVATSVLGSWVPDRTNLFAWVASSDSWALTAAGQASFDDYDPDRPFAQASCIAATAPTLMMYPTANVLVEQPDHIALDADWMGATRFLWTDGRDHPPVSERYYQGHSIAHWEDGELVIETTNFEPSPIGHVFSVASGPGKRVIERLALNAEGSSLMYQFTLEDPDYLAAPVHGEYQWHYRPDVRASSEPCDLAAASRFLQD